MVIDFRDTFRPGDWSNLGSGIGLYVSPGGYQMVLQVERVGGTNQASSTSDPNASEKEIMDKLQKAAEQQRQMQDSLKALGGP
jgi:hypothetical protein